MITVPSGAFGFDESGQAVSIDTNGGSNYIRVKTGPWLNIFRRQGVELTDVSKNELGLYTMLEVDGYGKAKFMTINPAYHMLRPRQNGCVWDPNGRIRTGLTEIDTCPIEYQGEQCPDAYWNTCFESLFGPGNEVRDLSSSTELQRLLSVTLASLSTGLGNSFNELVHFGLHPLITEADTNNTFAVDDERWEAFYNQMVGTDARPNNCSGLVTLLDSLADQGETGYNISIPDADIDANNNYTGDIVALFEQVINAAKSELRLMARRGIQVGGGAKRYPIMLVSGPEFRAYKQYLITNFAYSPSLTNYVLVGTDGTQRMMPGVLHYEGIPVIEWDESSWFDEIVGTNCHRVALVAPGTFGIAADVMNIKDQFSPGTGLRVVQKLDPPYMGKIFMDTTLRWGTALADKDFVVYARNLTPA